MLASKAILASSRLVVVMASVALGGCGKPPTQPKELPKLPPPKLEEVQEAVKRIFNDAVVIDASRNPSFLVGDFNGDLSQDLAVVLKPAEGKLSELNREFPNWLAREPLEEVLPKSKVLADAGAAKPQPNPAAGQTVRFEQSDVLLAIVHGYGSRAWHDPQATQTHLLRDVVGTNMRILPFLEAVKAYKGTKPFPTIYGDLIQQTLLGQSGFLHFAGAIYSWYDPKNFKGEPVAVPGHSGASTMMTTMR